KAKRDERPHEEDPHDLEVDPEDRALEVGAGVPAVGVDEHQRDAGQGQQDVEFFFPSEGCLHGHAFYQNSYQPHFFRRVTWKSFLGNDPSSDSSNSSRSKPAARLSTMALSK